MTHCRIHEHMLASDAATGRRLVSDSLIVIYGGGFCWIEMFFFLVLMT